MVSGRARGYRADSVNRIEVSVLGLTTLYRDLDSSLYA